jgi:uncharacterized protein YqgC (DUF456 family)
MSALHSLVTSTLQSGLPALSVDILVLAVVIVLLVGGVAGSVLPVLPSGLLSLLGVYLYWWHTGYQDPGLFILAGLTLVALFAMAIEWLSGAISAKAGGASTGTTIAATVIGFVGLLVFGPIGFLLGTAGTVFAVTYYRERDLDGSVEAATVTLLGMLTSSLVQVLLTAGVLIVMVLVILL